MFRKSIGHAGSKATKTTSIAHGGGCHTAQKTGNQGAQHPDPKTRAPATGPAIHGGGKGDTDGKVALKPSKK